MAIYNEKSSRTVEVSQDSNFLSSADVTVKDARDDSFYAVFSYGQAQHLVLNNNITISNPDHRKSDDNLAFAISVFFGYGDVENGELDFSFVTGNNKSKKIKSSFIASTDKTLRATGFLGLEGLYITGQKFLYSFDVKAENKGLGNASAYGIQFYDLFANACINKDFTVSATANGRFADATASAFSIDGDLIFFRGIAGNITVSANSKYAVATSSAIEASDLDVVGKITGKITVSATGATSNQETCAYGIKANYISLENFDSILSVTAKNSGTTCAYGIKSEATQYNQTTIMSGTKGKINVTASSTDGDANAYGIFSADTLVLANFSSVITISSSSKNNDAWGRAIYGCNGLYMLCNIDKNISVTTKNNRLSDNFGTKAWGLYSVYGSVEIKDINANISVSSDDEGNAFAYCLQAGSGIVVGNINGSLTASATNKEHYGAGQAAAVAFDCGSSEFIADVINGKITVTAKDSDAVASGIEASNITIDDMKKSSFAITAKSKNGDASAVAMLATENLYVDEDGLNLGKITVNAQCGKGCDAAAYGIMVYGDIISSTYAYGKLSGNVTVSSNGIAIGIWADYVAVDSSVNLKISGTDAAYGYILGEEDSTLTISEATVKVGVTDKFNKDSAYAVWASSGTANQIVEICDKSTVHGNIDLAGGIDAVVVESGSKFKGALSNVEVIQLNVADSGNKNSSLWDIVYSDNAGRVNLEIDFDYGMTGDFLVCTKESAIGDWGWVMANGVDLSFNEGATALYDVFDLSRRENSYSDAFYDFELKLNGNKMILSVTDKI